MLTNIEKKISGIIPWQKNVGQGIEKREDADGMSWYDFSINYNSLPCEPELAIVVTAWCGQLKWLKAVLEQYRLSGAYVILSYDNPFYSWSTKQPEEMLRFMPNMQHFLLSNAFVMKHITYDCDKRNGWFWNVRYAQGILKQFKNIKYVYVTNGDCICEKPEGFKDVIKLLGDNDLISGQSVPSLIHTATMFFKIEAFNAVVDDMAEIMKTPVIGSHSPEVMLRETLDKLKIKVLHAPKQPISPEDGSVDMYACYNQDSTWKELLGFRNLFAEWETAANKGLEPLPAKYFDLYHDCIYFNGEERMAICEYYKTGDRRYLYQFWNMGEDSWYNRIYYLLEHYGDSPIYK